MALESQENTGQLAWEEGWKLSGHCNHCQTRPVDPHYSDCGQRKAASGTPGKLLGMQRPRPHPRPIASQSAFLPDH